MNTTTKYENAAPNWSKKVQHLGYTQAYADFLAQATLATGPILDVGTGTGAFALSWVEVGGSTDLTLLDPSAAMLERAHAKFADCGLTPKIAHCAFDDFSSDTKYKAILAAHALEHFSDPSDTIHKFADKLCSDGRLYLVVSKPHWCNWMIWLRFRHRWFRPEIISQMAQNAGLSALQIHSFRTGPPSRTSLGYIFSKPQT